MRDNVKLREPVALAAIWKSTCSLGFNMASEPLTGSLLRTLAAIKPAASFLELGSGTGLSTAWLLDGMDAQSQLVTMDNDEAVLSVLREHLAADARLKVVCANGDDFVHSLRGQQFDFIFADTWAGKYHLLDEVLAMLRPGGVYVIDDMLEQPNWPDGHAQKAAALIAYLEGRDDLKVTKLSWVSGLLIAVKG